MFHSIRFKQKIGEFFNGKQLAFSDSGQEVFSPTGTSVLRINLEQNWNRQLNFQANAQIHNIAVSNQDIFFLAADELNYVFLFSLGNILTNLFSLLATLVLNLT
jgi:hypothetical protein